MPQIESIQSLSVCNMSYINSNYCRYRSDMNQTVSIPSLRVRNISYINQSAEGTVMAVVRLMLSLWKGLQNSLEPTLYSSEEF